VPADEPNYLAHAFKSQYNLIGLGTALGFAVLSGTLLPIIVAAGVEMVVLPLVSGSTRFQRLVRARQVATDLIGRQCRKPVIVREGVIGNFGAGHACSSELRRIAWGVLSHQKQRRWRPQLAD